MFTGIVRELGTVVHAQRSKGLVRLAIRAPKTTSLVEPLESVSVNGVCLSVVRIRQGTLLFELIPETQRLTALKAFRAGQQVNLEPSLSLSDRLGGQILLGHIDGVGTVVTRRQLAGELILTIRLARDLHRFLVPKGPVAVDGASLTVGRSLGTSTFSVHLIPETIRQTTLGARKVGDRVNIELDYLAKLIWQFTHARNGPPQGHQVTRSQGHR